MVSTQRRGRPSTAPWLVARLFAEHFRPGRGADRSRPQPWGSGQRLWDMRRAGSGILAAAAGAVALAAAACGSVHQAAAPGASGSIQAQPPAATASLGSAAAARYDPCARSFPGLPVGRALASLYAGSLACDFVVPPGARRLAHAPDAGDGALQESAPLPGIEEVDRVQYWQAPGSPQG